MGQGSSCGAYVAAGKLDLIGTMALNLVLPFTTAENLAGQQYQNDEQDAVSHGSNHILEISK